MKKIIFITSTILIFINAGAQNIGIGNTFPQNKLQVSGNLLVSEPTNTTAAAPTPAQTITLVNNSSAFYSTQDTTGRLYDPGGPSGNYLPNLNSTASFQCCALNQKGMEFTIESINLGTGDSLIIKEGTWDDAPVFLAVGNGYNTPGKYIFNGERFYLQFKSNSDASVGSGFSLLFKRLYSNVTLLPEIAGYTGNSFLFDVKRGALRAGAMDNSPRGSYSVAMGQYVTASGGYSLAVGYGATASGGYSVALGSATASEYLSVALGGGNASGFRSTAFGNSTASDNYATAMGASTLASGASATAMGSGTEASGRASLATGDDTQATGDFSASLGMNTVSRGYAGTVVGMWNSPVLAAAQTAASTATPLFIVGNGDNSSTLSNAMLVRKDGHVGIGTNVPASRLHIDGGTDASPADASGYLVIGGISGTNIVFDNNEIMARNNAGVSTLYLQNDGGALEVGGTAAKPGGGTWLATSDARLKQDVSPYQDGLAQVLKIEPVNFHYNSRSGYDTTQQHVGVLAQQLKEISPYMVSTFRKDSTDYYKVDNSAMTYMLINGMKEQQQLIESLQEKIEKLESRLSKLEVSGAQPVN